MYYVLYEYTPLTFHPMNVEVTGFTIVLPLGDIQGNGGVIPAIHTTLCYIIQQLLSIYKNMNRTYHVVTDCLVDSL
jgi:hypothetical protein